MGFTAGVDIGGTFTDCVVIDSDGAVVMGKASSTPPNFEDGALDARLWPHLTSNARLSCFWPTLLCFTVARSGLMLSSKGVPQRWACCVTAGQTEPVFAMKAGGRLRGLPPEYIAAISQHDKPEPLVPRRLVREVHERVTAHGKTLVELDESQVRKAIEELLSAGAEAFAVSLLWSTVDPSHEIAVTGIVEEMAPNVFVSRSSEVIPAWGSTNERSVRW